MLDIARPFIDLEEEDGFGETALTSLAKATSTSIHVLMFSLLLARGANINARDSDGKTCLYACIENTHSLNTAAELEALILLIRSDADVYSVDKFGKSISDSAYTYNNWYSSYRGDLWDAALSQCG